MDRDQREYSIFIYLNNLLKVLSVFPSYLNRKRFPSFEEMESLYTYRRCLIAFYLNGAINKIKFYNP